jgi:hypothetical protein
MPVKPVETIEIVSRWMFNDLNDFRGSKMTCRKYKKLFSAYLDGDVDTRERRRFEAHLGKCEQCAADFARFEKVVALTAALPPIQPSPDFDTAIKRKITDGQPVAERGALFGRRAVAAFGVICLLLAATLGMYVYKLRENGRRGENGPIEILVGREVMPMVRSHTDENVFANFVMPTVPAIKTTGSGLGDMDTTISEDGLEARNFVLPFVIGEDEPQDELDTNYVIKRISLVDASDEVGL